jgi:hypothetical protein
MQNDSAPSSPPGLADSLGSSTTATGSLSPVLRYNAEISAIANCSKNATAPFNGSLYRGIAGSAATARDFLPHAVIYPGLYAKTPPHKRCPFWCLSLFESPAQMRHRFGLVKKTHPNYEKLTGMHCARVDLTKTDGIRTQANAGGHLEFFPYETFDGVKAVVEVQPPANE